MHDIILIGPQGSGKGTQSDRLAENIGVPHISLGTLFRAEVRAGTEVGKAIEECISRGGIVPSDVASEVITRRLSAPDAAGGVILDGFPRTLEQADLLNSILAKLGRKINYAIYLNISDEEALVRLHGRRVCTNGVCERNYHVRYHPPAKPDVCDRCGSALAQRKDDTPIAIKNRLALYHAETVPVIALYQGLGILHEINGQRTIDEVQAAIRKIIGKS